MLRADVVEPCPVPVDAALVSLIEEVALFFRRKKNLRMATQCRVQSGCPATLYSENEKIRLQSDDSCLLTLQPALNGPGYSMHHVEDPTEFDGIWLEPRLLVGIKKDHSNECRKAISSSQVELISLNQIIPNS